MIPLEPAGLCVEEPGWIDADGTAQVVDWLEPATREALWAYLPPVTPAVEPLRFVAREVVRASPSPITPIRSGCCAWHVWRLRARDLVRALEPRRRVTA
jgi:hypothetical protein